jgi:hypothetical protein
MSNNTKCNCKCHLDKKPKAVSKDISKDVPKDKRKPSKYAEFVRANYIKVKDLPVKERFKKISVMWTEEKSKQTK